MIELPAGGLKFKMGQKAKLATTSGASFDVYFAPDSARFKWFGLADFDYSKIPFGPLEDLVALGHEIAKTGHIPQITIINSRVGRGGMAMALELPPEFEANIKVE